MILCIISRFISLFVHLINCLVNRISENEDKRKTQVHKTHAAFQLVVF